MNYVHEIILIFFIIDSFINKEKIQFTLCFKESCKISLLLKEIVLNKQ